MIRFYTLLILASLLAASAWGAPRRISPYKQHRHDALRVLPLPDSSIVFIGNSITNIGEWSELFGGDPRVVNRGVSGALSDETLQNLPATLMHRPAAMCIMIGTNDIGTYGDPAMDSIAINLRRIIHLTRSASPSTRLIIQSIFPSTIGLRNDERGMRANRIIRDICREESVPFLDLWDDLHDITLGTKASPELSNDHLHINSRGYRIWTEKIAPLLPFGLKPTLPREPSCNYASTGQSYGMRWGQFGDLPVDSTDVLLIGDEMIHGGEWRELFQNPSIKNRGNGWWYGGRDLAEYGRAVKVILSEPSAPKHEPRQIFLYCGVKPVMQDTVAIDTVAAEYRSLIDSIRSCAPSAPLMLMSLIPSSGATARTDAFNRALRRIALDTPGAEYVDIYSPLLIPGSTEPNPLYINHNYVTGRGYIRLAAEIEHYLRTDVTPLSARQAERRIAQNGVMSLSGLPRRSLSDSSISSAGRGHSIPKAGSSYSSVASLPGAYALSTLY